VVEATIQPRGPYSLRLTAGGAYWRRRLHGGGEAEAVQLADGRVHIRASDERALDGARFVLALDDDTSEFHVRFRDDQLLGRATRMLRGLRPRRRATVTHALVRGICGQLVQARRALELERAAIRLAGEDPPSREAVARVSPAQLVGCGLAPSRAAALVRAARTIDLERLRTSPDTALPRLRRERGIGEWTVGVVALQGLGRYDTGLVGDLGLVKLQAALEGRWPEASETAALLEPYGEWQGLASVFLLEAFSRGLVPGVSMDRARLVRSRVAA
jgi:3-methyladenine DNA glycosylase/8-oxoguanine DNA glycosylase